MLRSQLTLRPNFWFWPHNIVLGLNLLTSPWPRGQHVSVALVSTISEGF